MISLITKMNYEVTTYGFVGLGATSNEFRQPRIWRCLCKFLFSVENDGPALYVPPHVRSFLVA